MTKAWKIAVASIGMAGLVACAGLPRGPLTAAQLDIAEVPGFPAARYWADVSSPALERMVEERLRQERQIAAGDLNWLMLSGGGEDGAFGAGVLNGLTESKRRPNYSLVSGVSTGALSAPFAFLGPAYDSHLRDVYTGVNQSSIFTRQIVRGVLGGEALLDTTPLEATIARHINAEFLAAVAREHQRGRRLYVITTNLDAQRPVVWDMGMIARRGGPEAQVLFRRVLLASASVPGLFPPVMIQTDADGQRIEEMHVDGGTTMQVLTLPLGLDLERRLRTRHKRNVYLIMNSRMRPDFEVVQRSTLPIAMRSISTLIKNNGMASVRSYYEFARAAGMGFSLAYIDSDFEIRSDEPFDRAYMTALFDYGRAKAMSGTVWRKSPLVGEQAQRVRNSRGHSRTVTTNRAQQSAACSQEFCN